MECGNPLAELLTTIEQQARQDFPETCRKPDAFAEFERMCRRSGLNHGDLARLMGVSDTQMAEWIARRIKPSPTALQLMRLIAANPALCKQLID